MTGLNGKIAALLTSLLCASAAFAQNAPIPASPSIGELYTLCTFYPEPGTCDPVYARAATDNTIPAAESARATYQSYVRYLNTDARALTPEDMAFLKTNNIALPDTLTPTELGGLHGVITDPALQRDAAAKLRAVNAFLGRAVQAHIYCVLHDCKAKAASQS
jgi:hypothetical protein